MSLLSSRQIERFISVPRRALIALIGGVIAITTVLVAPAAEAFRVQAVVPATEAGVKVAAVSRGGLTTCAVLSTGQLKCWGGNSLGALGQGDTTNRGDGPNEMGDFLVTVDLGAKRKVKAVAIGYVHACALLDNGRVKCWGAGGMGQLGYQDDLDRGDQPNEMGNRLPYVNLGAGRRAKTISAGVFHTCALLDNGTVKCWGDNTFGQLGYDDEIVRGDSSAAGHRMGNDLPAVNLGRKAKAVVAGGKETCAILDNGALKCWGNNVSGQAGLGDNTGAELQIGNEAGEMAALQPVNRGTGRTAKAVAIGADHTCALLDNGTLKCWGDNASGQLGYGDVDARGDDESVASLGVVNLGIGRRSKAITAWGNTTCVILDNTTVKCWGDNGFGQIGIGSNDGDNAAIGDQPGEMAALLPINLGNGRTAKSIGGGIFHHCAVLDNSTLKCWGRNEDGELGLGNNLSRGDGHDEMGDNLPTVNLGVRVRLSSSYQYHSCAILENRSVQCWGWNGAGEDKKGALGLGDDLSRGDDPGEMGNSLPTVDLGAGRTAKALSVGPAYAHTCAILDDNTLKCWGDNSKGQLGLDDTTDRGDSTDAGHEMGDKLPAVNLGSGRTARAVATGGYHTCALLDNGTVKCWGDNAYGQLGYGDSTHRGDGAGEMAALLPVSLGRKAKAIAAGTKQTCALLDNGTVKCWGDNSFGQLGLGSNVGGNEKIGDQAGEMAALLPVSLGRKAKAIAAGGYHTCALLDNGTVKCWGYNLFAQLGQGDRANRGDEPDEMGNDLDPVNLGSGRTARAVATGGYHTCALLDNGTVKCWGYNDEGSLGLGDTANRGDDADEMGDYLPAAAVGGSRRVLAVGVGEFSCALLDDYSVRCWGYNGEGQLGRGDTANRGDGLNEMGNNLTPVPFTG